MSYYKGVGAPEAPVPISGKCALLFSYSGLLLRTHNPAGLNQAKEIAA